MEITHASLSPVGPAHGGQLPFDVLRALIRNRQHATYTARSVKLLVEQGRGHFRDDGSAAFPDCATECDGTVADSDERHA
jgi:hypothetical protein